MKFIKLESRGGNYLVVAENVAWLRTAENGQTSVGIIGGQPLLVVGSIEEVAEKILNGTAEGDKAEPAPAPRPAPAAAPTPVSASEPEPEAAPVPEPAPAPAPAPAPQPEEASEPDPAPAPAIARPAPRPATPSVAKGATLAERVAAAAAAAPRVKGSQRMKMHE
jgi:outer membrane biosynthesis protein TonB